ncbi:MAG: tetratricopeptide repeat protein, partial [Chitinispirillia bacterium]
LRKQIAAADDLIREAENEFRTISLLPKDSILNEKINIQEKYLDSSRIMLASMQEEYNVLKGEFLESGKNADKFGIEIQTKYLDWSFMRYLDKKKQLEDFNEQISMTAKKGQKKNVYDTTKINVEDSGTIIRENPTPLSDSALHYLILNRDKLTQSISDDRERLKEHIDIFLDANPASNYNPQILFRLSELYYDEAVEDFSFRLDQYERLRDTKEDSVELEFPEYNLDNVINLYDKIITQYPDDWLADDALFYKAHALKKIGYDDNANREFERLIIKYPESEYYVEANMNIGSYYFSNSTLESNTGLKLAEEAYRRVLAYREHPQFVHAIYHLGWCYYMQDQYDNAISVFKYLVEEVDLDFSISKVENTQVLNPLMREEAIDYIAISFDERNDLDGAINFLSLIGNIDYSALVFKRIGELREEDLDFDAAVDVYTRLIDVYSLSSIAPDATENLIKLYESNNKHEKALKERELFFKRYARGSEWYNHTKNKNPSKIAVVDSMSIANGLYVADDLYRQAEKYGRKEDYLGAMENYERLVETYPDVTAAAEALWNLAIILDSKLNEKEKAYNAYISFSRLKNADEERREQAALNAIALVQKVAASDTGISDTGKHIDSISYQTSRIIKATENYVLLFPNGKSYTDVVMNMGSIYFNKKLYSEAISTYQIITKRGKFDPKYYNAGFLISKCLFGKEDWLRAAGGFEKVWKEAPDEFLRQEAFKLLLQSKFLYAEQLLRSGDYNKAAIEYRNIDRKYPGSEYGDITLFNSAEAFEKQEDWLQSCKTYFELYQKYPLSKLAPDALFNAASTYEKEKRYSKSAEMYELIIKNYPKSAKAKDALFNVGFSYEKLNEFDKLAESNELYSKLYPGEKDVELMLFRSAEFYFKSSNFQKSITLYKNYITRYPKNSRTVEAYFKIGKCHYENNDFINSIMSFNQAEEQNQRFISTGSKGDGYFAGEAAFALAKIKQKQCSDITFNDNSDNLKDRQKDKTALLTQGVNAYQRVMKYKSEKMFEAAYRIGEMYEEYAYTWSKQRLDINDPIKLAVAKKDIDFASASLMKKAFDPLKKVIELGTSLDVIVSEQQQWIDSAKIKLSNNCITVGNFMINGISSMQKSPIPRKIEENILYLFQYRKQLLETLEPLKAETRDFFLNMYKELEKQGIKDKNFEDCYNKFGQINFLIPNEYEKLSEQILSSTDDIPKNLSEAEKEELIFQFEDIVFELQDKALFGYEDALALAQKEN